MKVLVVGLGNIAHRHIKNIKILYPDFRIGLCRHSVQQKDLGELRPYMDDIFFDIERALTWKPDVTLVTNPASFHVQTALHFAAQGSHLFIEKPLSIDLHEVDTLLQECDKRMTVLMVGYVLRFCEPLKILKQALIEEKVGRILSISSSVGRHLTEWRPGRDYRQSVSVKRELGGGAIFELSHELDYVRWLIGEIDSVFAYADKVSDFDSDVEDVAEIILRFRSGTIGRVHLDMVDYASHRSCRIVGTYGTLLWSFSEKCRVQLYSARLKKWVDLYSSEEFDNNEMYMEELKHFFDCVAQKKEPLVTGKDGRRVLEIALAAKKSIEEGKSVTL